ncbi:prephenate dehydratase [Candidatus Deianiraea vastatrix]|uniref:prephenate dehydratase n=1 Tax=Candidatus Deianiraea vastatrix TaxID=2163644 RepID=A0A5B8XFE8_9RICK|nr:prephenate dehydratase domain-containing protein [Candidatus Deianiraea vastatrix]QED23655.1 Prephenate dehydratase [Candidatus Deianiraea vastatrix]
MKIGYQGTDGAYSHIASQILSPNSSYIGFYDFFDAFAALNQQTVDKIVIPIENSYAGRVADVHRLIAKNNIYFEAEYILKIQHQLLANHATKPQDITEILSHEQAIMQCQDNLKRIFATTTPKLIPVNDTADAAKRLMQSNNTTSAVIASSLSAKIYNLQIIHPDIQDAQDNFTNFILMSKKPSNHPFQNNKNYITSLIFAIDNKSGGLAKILNILCDHNIDLLKIESYIPGGVKSHKAEFFISCSGHTQDPNLSIAMPKLHASCLDVKLFGSYLADEKRL